jgi:small subunit ribosomal protein S21
MTYDNRSRKRGLTVYVSYDNVEKALRKFKKKIQETGLIQELREKEFYEKPTTARKKARSQAKRRWQKKIEADSLPKRLY